MLSNIASLQLRGGNFDNETNLELFPNDNSSNNKYIKSVVIFGRNGAGKSTISRAFSKISGQSETSILKTNLYDQNQEKIELSDKEKQNIFVFNEDFVDRNIKTKQSGLNTIVILGEQVKIDNQIEEVKQQIDTLKKKGMKQRELCDKYNDRKNNLSPSYFKDRIDAALRGKDSWAERSSDIESKPGKRRKNNAPVRQDTYKQFINLNPSMSRNKLLKYYFDLLDQKRKIEAGNTRIESSLPSISQINIYLNYSDKFFEQLIAKKIEKPILSDREKRLLKLLKENGLSELINRKKVFENAEVKTCPFCFQDIASEYKYNLVKDIETILNKEVEVHQSSLKKFVINTIDIDFDGELSKLTSYKTCLFLLDKLNREVNYVNQIINKKILDPYKPVINTKISIADIAQKLKTSMAKLENERTDFNKQASDTDKIVKELKKINDQIAYYDIEIFYRNFVKATEDKMVADNALDDYLKEYKKLSNQLSSLESQKRNTKLAADSMNSYLNYIFCSDDRMHIQVSADNEYQLLSRNERVTPQQISEGERNILGLCYFFTRIFANKNINTAYATENLIVIDDPISSFDQENKVGIISFLKFQLTHFLNGNEKSRAIIFSHDIQVVFDLNKMLEEVNIKSKSWISKYYQLSDNQLSNFGVKKFDNYNFYLKSIYEFGFKNNNEFEPVIGNMMRQVLEAFATFKYQKGIEEITNDNEILNLLDVKYRTYFYDLMYRLVLNGDSHLEDNVRDLQDINFFATKSPEEKQRIAQDVLCLIYLLDKLHFKKRAQNTGVIKLQKIKEHCGKIKNRALPR